MPLSQNEEIENRKQFITKKSIKVIHHMILDITNKAA